MMDYQKTAKEFLAALGGKENIVANMTCMTRLRVTVSDHEKVDVPSLKK